MAFELRSRATVCESVCYRDTLNAALAAGPIEAYEQVHGGLIELLSRYVAVPEDWCPARYRTD